MIVDPAALAESAMARIALPEPDVHMSPDDRQIVGLPSWLWLELRQRVEGGSRTTGRNEPMLDHSDA